MRTIHKFPIEVTFRQEIEVETEADCLLVDNQEGKLCLWFEIEDTNERTRHTVYIVGTGEEIPGDPMIDHLGSVISGSYVWHVYMQY